MTNIKATTPFVQQVAPIVDPCPNCKEAALVSSGLLQVRPQYIHLEKGQPKARLVKAYVLCLHCMRRMTVFWDDKGIQTEEVFDVGIGAEA